MARIFLQSEKRPLAELKIRLNLGATGYCVDVDKKWICKLSGKISRIPICIQTTPPSNIIRCDARECIVHYLNPSNQNIKVGINHSPDLQQDIKTFFESLSEEFASEVDITKSPAKEVYSQLISYTKEITDAERQEIRALLNTPQTNTIFHLDDEFIDFLRTSEERKKFEEESLKLSKLISPIFEYQLPPNEKITVYDENLNVTRLAEKELGEKFNFTFRHGLFYDNRETAYFSNANLSKVNPINTKTQAELEQFLKNPKNYFNLMFVSKTIGHGAIANQDIPANTIIGIYSAKVMQDFRLHRNRKLGYDMMDRNRGTISSAGELGDLTRFINHFPKSSENNRVLCANVDMCASLTSNGFQLEYFKTNQSIKKGELIGFDYGPNYWATDPLLFLRNSKPGSLSLAKFTNNTIEYLNETITLPVAENMTLAWNKEKDKSVSASVASTSSIKVPSKNTLK